MARTRKPHTDRVSLLRRRSLATRMPTLGRKRFHLLVRPGHVPRYAVSGLRVHEIGQAALEFGGKLFEQLS